MFENKNFQSWFKENTPKEGLSETTTFSKQFVKDAWDNGYYVGYNKAKEEIQEQGLALQSDMDKTIEQNIALKKQIEKMKCCHNCRKFHNLSYDCTCAEVCNEWELREIKENE